MKPVKAKLTVKQLILLLLCASALLYAIHYLIFRDLHHLAIFGLHELAFVPLEVILVTLGLDQLVEKTHREEARSKVSIIETLYFNESGGTMLRYLTSFDPDAARLRELLQVTEDWRSSDFRQAIRQLKSYPFLLDLDRIDFFGLHYHLSQRHEYYRSMLENPALTQSEAFTEMIMKIYLLWEELDGRTNLYQLPEKDRSYLAELLHEIYRELTEYWLDNVYNHSIHNRFRLHRAIESNPFLD
ncbi:MAG: hypothetical protein Q4D08_07850 [Clostridia bacterium]|nr:hypothetical protein [Clostridia bacterium]